MRSVTLRRLTDSCEEPLSRPLVREVWVREVWLREVVPLLRCELAVSAISPRDSVSCRERLGCSRGPRVTMNAEPAPCTMAPALPAVVSWPGA
ncbi:hypothetical protein [Micromonospora wenchangensis]|uniref:hypothetical protein n=1 Tax=Micromonospora wenchangensis TaxID=1185415 RepID=UPI003418B69E